MNITIEGTYKYRVRTKILWFWVVQPVKTVPIRYEKEIATEGSIVFAPIKNVPVLFSASATEDKVILTASAMGHVWKKTWDVQGSQRIKAEPIKGCVLDVTARVG